MPAWPAIEILFPGDERNTPAGEQTLQDRVLADLDGLDIVAITEPSPGVWQVCFRSEAERAAGVALLRAIREPGAPGIRPIELDDEDWARRSQAALRAVRVGRIVVAPPWDADTHDAGPDLITVIIEPAMGFGSGHHATTRLCLGALQRLDLHGRSVLDVGTGSGVLALAAARLGAARVLAIDVDPDAIDNARGNACLNGAPPEVQFRQADFRQEHGLNADIVAANLTGGMLVAGAAAIARLVTQRGTLILSGITAEERDAVYRAFADGFRMEWNAEEDGWCCALLRAAR